jgi:hypothetical protein
VCVQGSVRVCVCVRVCAYVHLCAGAGAGCGDSTRGCWHAHRQRSIHSSLTDEARVWPVAVVYDALAHLLIHVRAEVVRAHLRRVRFGSWKLGRGARVEQRKPPRCTHRGVRVLRSHRGLEHHTVCLGSPGP